MILLAMSGWATAGWTALIIVLSAYFVAAEFALMAAKPHRLEEAAGTAAGRAAVKNSHELTLVLAGSSTRCWPADGGQPHHRAPRIRSRWA